jgi:heptosyltransferase-2
VPSWVGDAVMAEPALRQMRRIFARSRITLLARPWVAGLFEGEELADSIIPIPDARGVRQSVGSFFSLARRLRRERFDLAILLQNAFGAALLARAGRARRVAGYATDGRRALLDLVIPFEPGYKTAHQVFYYLNIAARIEQALTGERGVENRDVQPRLRVGEREKEQALLKFQISNPSPILILNPGATNSRAKRWLPERFAQTADRLAERNAFQTIIVGAAGDAVVADETARLMRSRAVVLAGRTTVAELKAILACASLALSNDTGTAHISAALGVPTVVVFGPTEHVSTRPLSDVAAIVRRDVECSPCMLRDCPIDHRCMTRVEVDDVYRAASDLVCAGGASSA